MLKRFLVVSMVIVILLGMINVTAEGSISLTASTPKNGEVIDVDKNITLTFDNTVDSSDLSGIIVTGGGIKSSDYIASASDNVVTISFQNNLLPNIQYNVSIDVNGSSGGNYSGNLAFSTIPYKKIGGYHFEENFNSAGLTINDVKKKGFVFASTASVSTSIPEIVNGKLNISYDSAQNKNSGRETIILDSAKTGIVAVEAKISFKSATEIEAVSGLPYFPRVSLMSFSGNGTGWSSQLSQAGSGGYSTARWLTIAGKSAGDIVDNQEYSIKVIIDTENWQYDGYFNGIKMNTAPVACGGTDTGSLKEIRIIDSWIDSANIVNGHERTLDDIYIYNVSEEVYETPAVLNTFPADNAASISLGTKSSIAFTEPIDEASLSGININNGAIISSRTLSADKKTVNLSFESPLLPDTTYTISANGIKSSIGISAASFSYSFTTIADASNMVLEACYPVSGITNFLLSGSVLLSFNHDINDETLGMLALNGGKGRIASAEIINGNSLEIVLSELESNKNYTIDLSGLKSSNDDIYIGENYSFTTVSASKLTLTSSTPANNASDVLPDIKKLTATFNNNINADTLSAIKIRGGNNPINFTPSADGKTVTLSFTESFSPSVTYTADFSGLGDEYGQTGGGEISFTIEAAFVQNPNGYNLYESFDGKEEATIGNATIAGVPSIYNDKLLISYSETKKDGRVLFTFPNTVNGSFNFEYKLTMTNGNLYFPRRRIMLYAENNVNNITLLNFGRDDGTTKDLSIAGVSQGAYVDGQEYDLKFEVDVKNNSYTAYLNGNLIVTVSLGTLENVKYIRILESYDDKNGTHVHTNTIDELRIYETAKTSYEAPALTASIPENNADNVSEEFTAELQFDQPMDIDSFKNSTLFISHSDALVKEVRISADKKTVTVIFENDLEFSTAYQLNIEGVKSIYGKEYTGNISFTTRAGYFKVKNIDIYKGTTKLTSLVNGTITVKAQVENFSAFTENAVLIVAIYDAEDKSLTDIKSFTPKTFYADEDDTLTGDMDVLIPPGKTYELKAFVWDDIYSMKPVTKPYSIRNK